jgi:hypothetical protein
MDIKNRVFNVNNNIFNLEVKLNTSQRNNEESVGFNPLEQIIKKIISDKIKTVREDILLGEINLKQKKINFTAIRASNESYLNSTENSNELAINGVIVRNMLKSFKIKMSLQKRKFLVRKLYVNNKYRKRS